ncbi:AAA family ATPase, partial [Salmonella enterica]|nr:AAA family ATPase [Salmonella enterica]EJE9174781.1 AAA family ATPase [Salmonella enterica]EJE9193461.1 AAA family ATPase [Salmonella enterica]EJE9202558.1 AAA family ATPase [Salmonella enterica]EJE9248751.1 AAA family ATPase [Salmonella enterica]
GELMEKLTSGQRAATRMILETSDRFTVVQGYAGVGKTTQFRAVMSAVNMLPESERPRVVGLGPTHRAVGEMRSAGVDAQTLASFLHDTQLQQRSGETPDFSNTLFLLDESSMVGNTDMARAYALIAAGGGRAVASGDTDQLQAIAPGQPFRLQQTRSAADVAIMKEIVRQTPELREAVYSLINRDVERALSGLESVKPSQVPRLEGAWAPEHSVTEFSHSQEAKLAEAQQKAMLKGEAFPDVPMTLYEAIVRDYTGRTPEAREQTLIVTHLNEDRRVLNSMIHDAREKAGELGKEQVMVPVLNTANIRDGELRRLSTWETHRDALVLVDNVYHRIAGISKDDGLITLQDAEGNTRLISPREAVAEGVTLYTPDTIRVGTGDRMRFTKSDRERGYVANSVWTVTAVSGDSVTLSDGQQTRVIRPARERAEQHIDLAYAITGGRVWGDIPDNSVQPGAGNGEPVTAEVLAQRQAEEAIRRETERRADEIVRKMAENKPDLPDGKTEQAVREIAGQERERAVTSERETALPESVLRELQREREAVREIARENLLQERLQQMERDMVRDLQKEKTLGGD